VGELVGDGRLVSSAYSTLSSSTIEPNEVNGYGP